MGAYKCSHTLATLAHLQPEKYHVGAHLSEPRQTYIGAQMYGPSSDVWLESIHPRMNHTSEFWCMDNTSDVCMNHTSVHPYIRVSIHRRYCPYIGALMFEHAFQRMATFIWSFGKWRNFEWNFFNLVGDMEVEIRLLNYNLLTCFIKLIFSFLSYFLALFLSYLSVLWLFPLNF